MALQHALRRKILSRISPTPSEAAEEKRFALSLAERLARAFGAKIKIHFVGSTARDTGLRGDKDVDLFVSFPRSLKKEEIVARTIAVTKKTIRARWEMHYAEHPYLQAEVGGAGGFKVEVIPCFATRPHEKLKSAVDRSPLHMTYLQERLTRAQREDVRLLKQLLKAHGVYGAEARVGGFSGLLCEYLVLNYRSLDGLMREAAQWKPQVVIDIEGHYAGEKPPFAEPLVFIDAIDRNRNAAAPVTETTLHKFILLAREYKAKPTEALFFPKRRAYSKHQVLAAMRKRGTDFLLLEFRPPRVVEDILYPQLARTTQSLRKQLEAREWRVLGAAHYAAGNRGFILLELESLSRARLARVYGPPVAHADAVRDFLRAHRAPLRGPFVEGARVVVEEERGVVDAQAFLKQALKKPVALGVASHLRAPLRSARFRRGAKVGNAGREALACAADYLF
jgi:tRNA nucleotidyltransferase (CCA-adding enzyme)